MATFYRVWLFLSIVCASEDAVFMLQMGKVAPLAIDPLAQVRNCANGTDEVGCHRRSLVQESTRWCSSTVAETKVEVYDVYRRCSGNSCTRPGKTCFRKRQYYERCPGWGPRWYESGPVQWRYADSDTDCEPLPPLAEYVNKGTGPHCVGLDGKSHPGGVNAGVYHNQNACEAACTANPSCVAYDWFAPNLWCVIAETCGVSPGKSGWTHVEKKPFPEYVNKGTGPYCVGQDGKRHPGGVNAGVYPNWLACEAACTANPSCVAYDWFAPNLWCVIAETCKVSPGKSGWTHVEKKQA